MIKIENQVLAVWGGPSCGKTTVSAKIAKYLSSLKKNVALILCDTTAPPLPLLLPPSELEIEKSLGSILSAVKISENLVLQNSITIKKQPYISIVGMLKGENCYSYPRYTDKQAVSLIERLRNIADFIIVDCSSHITDDILSTIALTESDCVLRIINCDLKSVSYLSSQLTLLADKKFKTDMHLKIANNVKSIHSGENIEQILGGLSFTLPNCADVEMQYLTGELLKELPYTKETKEFRRTIQYICEEVFDL